MVSRKFCVMTIGRSGSTSLMNALEAHSDIALPSKNISCVDNELVHPKVIRHYMQEYSKLADRLISTSHELIECFYALNQNTAYAGFKSMPNRHQDFAWLTQRRDITFITLSRRDLASTVASFMLAMSTGSWRRNGEAQPYIWRFDQDRHGAAIRGNVSYILNSQAMLESISAAIKLEYEDLCDPAFKSNALDAFFGRSIRLKQPKPPTQAKSYVENWHEFSDFIQRITAASGG